MNVIAFILIILAIVTFLYEAVARPARPLWIFGLALFAGAWMAQSVWQNTYIHLHS